MDLIARALLGAGPRRAMRMFNLKARRRRMGILDGYPFDPGMENGNPPPGWLGLVLGAQAHAHAHPRAPRPAGEAMPAPAAPGFVPGLGLALAPASAAQAAPPRPRFLGPGV